MGGMHPRLKARRGRFGPGGLTAPTLRIVSPANGATILGSPTTLFVGQANDDLQGDISSSIEWFVAGPGSPNTGFGSPSVAVGASVDLSAFFTLDEEQTVVARVTDSGGKTSTVSITVTVNAA